MMKQPIRWFFNRIGLGMALANSGARTSLSRNHVTHRYMEDEMILRYLGTEHFHETDQ